MELKVSERRVCRVLGQHSFTQPPVPLGRDGEAELTRRHHRAETARNASCQNLLLCMRRILYLDRFRFLVVSLAIAAHVVSNYGAHEIIDSESLQYIMLLTRTATPSLLILLGIMVQLVYAPLFLEQPRDVARRILYRSVQCYVAFLVIVTMSFLTAVHDISHTLQAFAFLRRVANGSIFQLYVVLLPISIILLWAQRAWGISALGAVILLIWLMDPFLMSLAEIWPARLDDLGQILFGLGGHWGPSVFHGISLVALGMLLGTILASGGDLRRRKVETFILGAAMLASIGIIGLYVAQEGIRSFAASIVHFDLFRANNDMEYYAFGTIAALSLLVITRLLSAIIPNRHFTLPDQIGAYTLTFFLIGEVLMFTLPQLDIPSLPILIIMILSYISVAGGLTLVLRRFQEMRRRKRLWQHPAGGTNLVPEELRRR